MKHVSMMFGWHMPTVKGKQLEMSKFMVDNVTADNGKV